MERGCNEVTFRISSLPPRAPPCHYNLNVMDSIPLFLVLKNRVTEAAAEEKKKKRDFTWSFPDVAALSIFLV